MQSRNIQQNIFKERRLMMFVKKTCSENILVRNKLKKNFKNEDSPRQILQICDPIYDNKS